jgi:hypothetical protein
VPKATRTKLLERVFKYSRACKESKRVNQKILVMVDFVPRLFQGKFTRERDSAQYFFIFLISTACFVVKILIINFFPFRREMIADNSEHS